MMKNIFIFFLTGFFLPSLLVSQTISKTTELRIIQFPDTGLAKQSKEEVEKILAEHALPSRVLKVDEISETNEKIVKALGAVLNKTTNLMSGLSIFENWLVQQKCIHQCTIPILDDGNQKAVVILTSQPAQIRMHIEYNLEKDEVHQTSITFSLNIDKKIILLSYSVD